MRTKLFTLALICAVALGFVSCGEETDKVNVTVNLKAPKDVQRRAAQSISDAKTANKLVYAIYEAGTNTLCDQGEADFQGGLSTTISVALAAGQSYDFVYFAYNEDAAYEYDAATRSVTLTYDVDGEGIAYYEGSIETMDAYYAIQTLNITKNFTANVTLRRLTAQINVGTTEADYNACVGNPTGTKYYEPTTVDMTVSGVYTTVDMSGDEPVLGGQIDKVNYLNIPVAELDGETYPVDGEYVWLAANYFLTDEQLVTVDFVVKDENDAEKATYNVLNVPVQKNFRTNIYGDLLMGKGEITVTKSDEWDGSYDNVIPVSTPEELTQAIAQGGNYQLVEDIVLTNAAALDLESDFNLNLDGNTLTMSKPFNVYADVSFENGKIEYVNEEGASYNRVVILREDDDVTFRNMTVETVNAYLVTQTASFTGNVLIENVDYNVEVTTSSSNGCMSINGSGTTEIKSSNLSTSKGNALEIWENSVVKIDNSHLVSNVGDAGIFLGQNSHSQIEISDCVVEGVTFAIASNASDPNSNIVVKAANTTFKVSGYEGNDGAAAMLNVMGDYQFKGCTFISPRQAYIARGGNHVIENSTLETTSLYPNATKYYDVDWRSSNEVPAAALTAGNRTNAYKYPTNVTVKDCLFKVSGANAANFANIYLYANPYVTDPLVFNHSGSTFEGGSGVWYQSTNILVNGVEITTPVHEEL